MPESRRIRTAGRPTYGSTLPPRGGGRPSYLRWRPSKLQGRILGALAAAALVVLVLGKVFAVTTIETVPASLTTLQSTATQIVASDSRLQNLLLFDQVSFTAKLLAADPSLKGLEVERRWPGTLVLKASLKSPSLGWVTGNEGYILDSDGTVIGDLPSSNKLPTVYDNSNLPVKTGQAVVSARFVDYVRAVNDQIPNTGLTITRFDIKDTTYDLYATTKQGYQLKLDTSREVSDAARDLKAVLANLKQAGKTPTQYIDLRIPGRAYYK